MKLSLNGLMGYLQGKGWKIKMNAADDDEDEEVFEVEEGEEEEETEEEKKKRLAAVAAAKSKQNASEDDEDTLSAEELLVMRNLARVLVKNGKLIGAIETGTLEAALNAVPAAAELVKNAQAREKTEKDQLIATIKSNSSNTYTDEELASMPNPVLVKLNAQMNVSYAGLGGGSLQQNAEQPLIIQPVLLAKPAEATNGS